MSLNNQVQRLNILGNKLNTLSYKQGITEATIWKVEEECKLTEECQEVLNELKNKLDLIIEAINTAETEWNELNEYIDWGELE